MLCRNNPKKTCPEGHNFDAAYADFQPLKACCGADVWAELVDAATGQLVPVPGASAEVGCMGHSSFKPATEPGCMATMS